MQICSDSHDEIVYGDKDRSGLWMNCPLCEALATIDALEKEKTVLEEDLGSARDEIDQLSVRLQNDHS